MTDTERLPLHAAAAQLDLLCLIAKAVGAYHGGAARNLQEKIEAVLNSQTADEMSQPHHEAAKAVLWCCHVRGPDDIYAAPDYETALKWADLTNAINFHVKPLPQSYEDCPLKAVPAPWPWSAEAHAEDVPKSINEFAVPEAAEK